MLAKAVDALPDGDGWLFEPKWDGFRALVFRDGDEVYTQSRDLKPLDRYFPELADPLRAALPERCVLDGEVVIATDGAPRVRGAAAAHPPGRVAREDAGRGVAGVVRGLGPARPRRRGPARDAAGRAPGPAGGRARDGACRRCTSRRRPGTERPPPTGSTGSRAPGSTASSPSGSTRPYQPGKRAMLKIKHQRTADCVVAGFRWHKNGPGTHIGSLLLGLFDDEGTLHHVGVTSSFTWERREAAGRGARTAGASARSTATRGASGPSGRRPATPTRPASGCRAPPRAGTAARTCRGSRCGPSASPRSPTTTSRATASATATTFKRWRPDKPPEACRYDQLETSVPYELEAIFGDR